MVVVVKLSFCLCCRLLLPVTRSVSVLIISPLCSSFLSVSLSQLPLLTGAAAAVFFVVVLLIIVFFHLLLNYLIYKFKSTTRSFFSFFFFKDLSLFSALLIPLMSQQQQFTPFGAMRCAESLPLPSSANGSLTDIKNVLISAAFSHLRMHIAV